jgi:hypothetical protein
VIRILPSLFAIAILLQPKDATAQSAMRRFYLVPGAHYSTPARATVALTAFIDGRGATVGKGYVAIAEGGRDAIKAHLGIANVSNTTFGYSVQLSGMQTRSRPLQVAMPNSRYAGAEFHLLVTIVNLGAGYYAPVGEVKGRRGLLSLSAGIGF